MPWVPVTFKCLKPQETDFEPETLGEHVKKKRLLLRLTQKVTAHRLKVSQSSIIHWEHGDFQPSRVTTVYRIIEFLGYDPLPKGETIPERLRQKRRELGWGQRELATHFGVDRCTVTAWEGGGTIMNKAHRRMVARFLGLPESQLDREMRRRWNDSHGRPTTLCSLTEPA